MERINELINKIKKLGYTIHSTGYRNEEDAEKGIYTRRDWVLPRENYKLKNTPFFYDSGNDFIHFTSLDSLFSILNSGHLRLYNLLNMDDKLELEYARKALLLKTNSDEKIKEQLYSFSMCSSKEILEEEPKKKKHLLWKLHGKDGNGVIIRLKRMNELTTWRSYYLTKCFYDLEVFSAIKELNEITNQEILENKLACFIKLPIYDFEKEIRLVFDMANSEKHFDTNTLTTTYPKIYPDKLNKSDKISYFQLPLYNFYKDNDKAAYPLLSDFVGEKYETPKMSITEIILGYRYNDNDLKNLKERINTFDSTINVKMSDLKQYY